jgi:hypothetical protein
VLLVREVLTLANRMNESEDRLNFKSYERLKKQSSEISQFGIFKKNLLKIKEEDKTENDSNSVLKESLEVILSDTSIKKTRKKTMKMKRLKGHSED